MKIMVNLENTDDYQELDINENLSILDLKANLSTIFNFSWNEMELLLNGKPLANQLILGQINFKDDVVILRRVHSNLALSRSLGSSQSSFQGYNSNPTSLSQAFSQFMNNQRSGNNNNINYGNNNNNYYGYNPLSALMGSFRQNAKEQFIKKRVKELQDRFLTSPDDLNQLFNSNPELAEAIVSGNNKKVEDIVRQQVNDAEKKQKDEEMEYIRLMNSDPNDPEVQQKIAKIIQKKNIDENLRQAEEYMPETLFPVHMLFINLEINKKKVVALVDTGAQSTIMSQVLCEKCDLFNLCDTRFSGIAIRDLVVVLKVLVLEELLVLFMRLK